MELEREEAAAALLEKYKEARNDRAWTIRGAIKYTRLQQVHDLRRQPAAGRCYCSRGKSVAGVIDYLAPLYTLRACWPILLNPSTAI